ncbi:unnamed protein product [Scytosiphon promiscuus]
MRILATGRCLALTGLALVAGASRDGSHPTPSEDSKNVDRHIGPSDDPQRQRLAVVVPAYRGDLDRAVASLERWPSNCSPLTLQNVDLVLYYAEGEEDSAAVDAATGAIADSAGRCFANLRTVYAHLEKEEDAYPKGPSVMFYKMFLDERVRSELSEYDALAIVEWDVLVATDRSFEELYHAAFRVNEDFWVKGSNLEGTNLHSSAEVSEMWRVLGHINGNAIYNNNDPAFVEYVDYTRARWEYKYPYDVSLWLTISDFPYSWPLYQRYSSKFVITNLISYVGYEHVDHDTVSDAIAGQTLFIHGSRVDEGSSASITATSSSRKNKDNRVPERLRRRRRPGRPPRGHLHRVRPHVRRRRRWRSVRGLPLRGRELRRYWKARNSECPPGLPLPTTSRQVCDDSCGDGVHGDYNCNWRGLGSKCRFCFDDLEAALLADEVAKNHGGRVVMCSTMAPPVQQSVVSASVEEPFWPQRKAAVSEAPPSVDAWAQRRRLKGSNADSNATLPGRAFSRWDTRDETLVEEQPKWQANQKWRKLSKWKWIYDGSDASSFANVGCNRCMDSCQYTSKDGTRGRVCDNTCEDGVPYGSLGCGAKSGIFGPHCRACYNDVAKATARDSPDNRAIIIVSSSIPANLQGVSRRDPFRHVASPTTPAQYSEVHHLVEQPCLKPESEVSKKWLSTRTCRCFRAHGTMRLSYVGNDPKCDDDCEFINGSGTKGRVCDATCGDGDPYGTMGCNAHSGSYGAYCRACFYDVDTALEHDTRDDRAIMCETLKPVDIYAGSDQDREFPTTSDEDSSEDQGTTDQEEDSEDEPDEDTLDCDDGCEFINGSGTKGRVCDATCADGNPYGTLGCNARSGSHGADCRACFYDVDTALEHDTRDNRAIMCDTLLPVDIYAGSDADRETSMTSDTDAPADGTCEDGCEITSSDGTTGRVCDDTCEDGDPYGTLGCDAAEGACDTLMPVDIYSRRLSDSPESLMAASANGRRKLSASKPDFVDDAAADQAEQLRVFSEAARRPFAKGLKHGSLCAFVAGRADEVDEWTVTVKSILQFAPGVRVAVAVEDDAFDLYHRAIGGVAGVSLSSTSNAFTASLYADKYCDSGGSDETGADASIIMYVTRGSVFSRSFTSKDTHSPRGELLVVHSSARASHRDAELAKHTAAIIGARSPPPSFTYGTDLMLPVAANADLRDVLLSNGDGNAALEAVQALTDLNDLSAVPQVLAALQHSRQTEGVWFLDPQTWVSRHLFKEASIWDIPLVKPRFTCAINPVHLRNNGDDFDVAEVLENSLDFFSKGGKCTNGQIDFKP